MNNSILTSIKKLLGITADDTSFDEDIIIHINTVFMDLNQIGVGPANGFRIEDKDNIWSEFVEDDSYYDAVKTYIYLKVKLLFDPPLSSAVMTSINQSIEKLEWRLNVKAETDGNNESANKPIVEDGWCILVARE